MDAQEKLMALKKAYADIILNISKEAAARVMASERRTARYQHELKVAKDEALRMLVRLKQMMDSKIAQSEAASLNQQKKIEELEAQLQEAEDIVKDLREELGGVQAELERVEKNNIPPENEPDDFRSREIPMEDKTYTCQSSTVLPPKPQDEFPMASNVTMANLNERYDNQKCYNRLNCMCGSCPRVRDLPSILLRSKKPGLYRNGCTQRIRACDRNQLDRKLCFLQKIGQLKTDPVSVENSAQLCDNDSTNAPRFLIHKAEREFSLECAESSDKERTMVEVGDVQKDLETLQKVVSMREETAAANGSLSSDSKVDTDSINIPISSFMKKSSDIDEAIPAQSAKERVIKYTFQRKRKRLSLSDSDATTPLPTEKKGGDKPNGDHKLEPPKNSLLAESSRDSRRLAQVARQLISLSEKRWWQ